MVGIALTLLILPQQVARNTPPPPVPARSSAAAPAAEMPQTPQMRDAPPTDEYSSSQVTFFNGAAQNGDGRVDVMHFQDGKTAITAGKDWRCSYVNDPVQHRLAIVCDAAATK